MLTRIVIFGLGLLTGAALCGAVGWFWIYPDVAREKFDYGAMAGNLQARIEIANKIPATLGSDVDPHEPSEWFFSAKSASVVVVTRNGVKTLRYPSE